MPNLLSSDMFTSRAKYYLDILVRILVFLVAVAVGTSLYLILAMGIQIQKIGEQNRTLSEQNVYIGQRLIDCTTPGHECYEDVNKNTGKAVATINQITEAAVVCSKDLPTPVTIPMMDACIKKALFSKGTK